MHRCPQCDYAFGPLPGVPEDRFGEFTAAVRCPECSFEVPKGARLVVGASTEAGAQPLTTRRRTQQLLLALAPSAYMLTIGIEGVAGLISNGVAGFRVLDALRVLCLAGVGFIAWAAWRRWTPDAESDGRAPVSFDVRWMCVPGAIGVIGGSVPGSSRRRDPAARDESAAGTAAPVARARIEHIAAEDIRSIVANSPKERGGRWRADDRAVACVTASVWHRDSSGRRSDLRTLAVFVDTGADLQAAPPGRDRATALVEAGDAVARAIRRTVGVGTDDANAPAAAPDDGLDVLAVEGSLFALPPWPAAVTVPTLAFGGPAMIGLAGVLVATIIAIVRVTNPGANAAAPPWMQWIGAVGLAVLLIFAPLWWWQVRRARRRQSARCRWDVSAHGIRVIERYSGRKGDLVAEYVRDVPAERIVAVGPNLLNGRVRLVASDRVRKELASITLDEIPEGGAETLAARVGERLWRGQEAG